MSIEVVTAPENNWLTTRQSLKLKLGITDDSSDLLLDQFIKEASDYAETYTGRTFAKQTVKEKLIGKGLPNLMLSITPIVSVTSVTFEGTEVTDYIILDDKAGILQREFGWTSSLLGWGDSFNPHPSSYGKPSWEITYTGGYVLPSWNPSTGRNLPYDLERAVFEIAKTNLVNVKMDGSLSSYRIGETQASWARSSRELSSIPDSAQDILRYYRRPF